MAPENKIEERNTDYLFIWQNGIFKKIAVDEIMYLEASGNYCYVASKDGTNTLLSITLLKASNAIPSERFIRISRSHIVNIRYVDAICGNVIYMGEQKFTVSSPHRKELFSHFCFLGSNSRKLLPE